MRSRDAWTRAERLFLGKHRNEGTREQYRWTLGRFRRYFQSTPGGVPNPKKLQGERLDRCLGAFVGEGLAPVTLRSYFSIFAEFLEFSGNPKGSVRARSFSPRVRGARTSKAHAREAVSDLFHELAASPKYRDGIIEFLLLLGYGTGMRWKDLHQMTRGDFDAGLEEFTIPKPTKDNEATRPVHPWLTDRLGRQRYFLTRNVDEVLLPLDRKTHTKHARDAIAELGLSDRFKGWTLHTMRHTFNQVMADLGVDHEIICAYDGRTPPTGSARFYRRLSPRVARRRLMAVPGAAWLYDAGTVFDGPPRGDEIVYIGRLPYKFLKTEDLGEVAGYKTSGQKG